MVKHRLLKEPKLLIWVLGFNLQKYTPFFKGTVYRAVRHRSNILSTLLHYSIKTNNLQPKRPKNKNLNLSTII